MITVGDIRDAWYEHYCIRSLGGSAEEEYEKFGFLSERGEDFSFTLRYDDTPEGLLESLREFIEGNDPQAHAAAVYNAAPDPEESNLAELVRDAEAIEDRLLDAYYLANAMLDAEP